MKKLIKLSFVFLVVACIPLLLFACGKEKSLNAYKIEAVFDASKNTLQCSQEVNYVNNSDNELKEICFYLYANAFSQGQKPVSTAYLDRAYPNGESFGNISFQSVFVNGKETKFEINQPENSILTVELENPLYPTEQICIQMEYTITLANINHRLGYGTNAINFGNFFPIACVYQEGKGFVKNDFVANGDPFYSDISDFEVTIVCDEEFVVASTGNKTESIVDGKKKVVCQAERVRDFCFVLSKNFDCISETVGHTTVSYFYYDDELATEHLQTSVLALKTFQELFGEYPYKQLSVVKTNFCFGGMEYPNLVMISDALADNETFNYVIVHEIAHQWWYGVVGNNEYAEAWIDEGLTEFSTGLFFEKNPQYNIDYETSMQNAKQTYKTFVSVYTKINGDVDESMNRDLSEFDTEPEYVNCVYVKGMLLFDSLRSTMSERKFFKCLKDYYENMSFKNSSASDVIKSFSQSSGINLESVFNAWLEGNVYLN